LHYSGVMTSGAGVSSPEKCPHLYILTMGVKYMPETLDIHEYKKMYEATIRLLNKADISNENKAILLEYDRAKSLEGIALSTRIRVLLCLRDFATFLKKNIRDSMKDDIKNYIFYVDSRPNYSIATKVKYRSVLKRFFKWLRYGDDYQSMNDYPEEVKWLKINIKKKDRVRISREDLLTEEEIKKLIDVAEDPREKAFISLISDCGARIGEIGNLRIGDVYRDEFSFLVHLRGKTGEREDCVTYSDPYLAQWLNIHPFKHDKNAPLWVNLGNRNRLKQMKYRSFYKICKKLIQKAGINKKFHPHIFRHSRVTINLSKGIMTGEQAKVYFGWTPDTRMLENYSHLQAKDANDAIRRACGFKKEDEQVIKLKPVVCRVCHQVNGPDMNFCEKCGRPLNVKTELMYRHYVTDAYEIITKLLKDDKEYFEITKKKIQERGL